MTRKRFIAGAVCTHCGEVDRVRVFEDAAGVAQRECVACGVKEVGEFGGASAAPLGRLERAPRVDGADGVEARPVRLIDPGRASNLENDADDQDEA